MADVFISYKREDRRVAEAISTELSAAGFNTWWDTSLVAGEHFNEAIERELKAARCVLVLWSQASHASQWVQAEAIAGFNRKILVAARLDDVALEYPFGIVQTADLSGYWLGGARAGLDDVLRGIACKLDAPPPKPGKNARKRSARWMIAATAGLVAAAMIPIGIAIFQVEPARPLPAAEVISPSMTYQSWRAALLDPVLGPQMVRRGAAVGQRCRACHSFAADGGEHTGPSLQQAFGGRVAAAPDFAGYSQAIRTFSAQTPDWTYDALDHYLRHPEDLIPGTSMSFVGIPEPSDRAAMIAYLRYLSVGGSVEPE